MDDFVMAGECATGDETAVEVIRDGDADIVLMDIHMPGMGGIEAALGKSMPAQPDLMVVLMSTLRPRRHFR